ncbi:hypothetical protein B0H13DRAFT_2668430 [Mycena leptocephala]|nr:hypothetical protein B0H13DRAFT_2668430 [Mycena leptocephala]
MSHLLNHIPSRLCATCPDIILTILQLSGPADLATLGSTCHLFRSILDANPSCWQYTRATLKIPAPPVGRVGNCRATAGAFELQERGPSEETYIRYLFGGGTCSVCGRWTAQIPCSLALEFRCCSKKCRSRVLSFHGHLLVKIKPSDLKNHPGIQWLVPHPSPDGHIYYRTDLNAVKQRIKSLGRECKTRDEFNYVDTLVTEYAECRMATFKDVETWTEDYLRCVRNARQLNLDFLKEIGRKEKQKVHTLLMSPTLQRVFTAFNRDLTRMGMNDWRVIQLTVRRELKQPRAPSQKPAKQ